MSYSSSSIMSTSPASTAGGGPATTVPFAARVAFVVCVTPPLAAATSLLPQ